MERDRKPQAYLRDASATTSGPWNVRFENLRWVINSTLSLRFRRTEKQPVSCRYNIVKRYSYRWWLLQEKQDRDSAP